MQRQTPRSNPHSMTNIEVLAQVLNEDSLGVLVSCLCATGTEQKVLARKVRAAGCKQDLIYLIF